jgi:hypothetical protein
MGVAAGMGGKAAQDAIRKALTPDQPPRRYDAATLAPLLKGDPTVEQIQALLDRKWTPRPEQFKDTH